MTESSWFLNPAILPYVLCGVLGAWLGEHAFDSFIGPRFMHEFGLGALHFYGSPIRITTDIIAAAALVNVYRLGIRRFIG